MLLSPNVVLHITQEISTFCQKAAHMTPKPMTQFTILRQTKSHTYKSVINKYELSQGGTHMSEVYRYVLLWRPLFLGSFPALTPTFLHVVSVLIPSVFHFFWGKKSAFDGPFLSNSGKISAPNINFGKNSFPRPKFFKKKSILLTLLLKTHATHIHQKNLSAPPQNLSVGISRWHRYVTVNDHCGCYSCPNTNLLCWSEMCGTLSSSAFHICVRVLF